MSVLTVKGSSRCESLTNDLHLCIFLWMFQLVLHPRHRTFWRTAITFKLTSLAQYLAARWRIATLVTSQQRSAFVDDATCSVKLTTYFDDVRRALNHEWRHVVLSSLQKCFRGWQHRYFAYPFKGCRWCNANGRLQNGLTLLQRKQNPMLRQQSQKNALRWQQSLFHWCFFSHSINYLAHPGV